MKKLLLGSFILGAVAAVAVAVYMYNKPVESLEKQKVEVSISATELFSIFSENEVEAMTSYGDKVLEVEGNLIEILENSDGSTTLLLDGGDPIFGVKCRLDPSVQASQIPETGQKVRLKGLCIGMNADVEMNQCIIL